MVVRKLGTRVVHVVLVLSGEHLRKSETIRNDQLSTELMLRNPSADCHLEPLFNRLHFHFSMVLKPACASLGSLSKAT